MPSVVASGIAAASACGSGADITSPPGPRRSSRGSP
jgi:hypothetical protein